MAHKKFNPNWDQLLTVSQREMIAKPGFGILQQLPYLEQEDVKKVITILEDCLTHLELLIIDEQPKVSCHSSDQIVV